MITVNFRSKRKAIPHKEYTDYRPIQGTFLYLGKNYEFFTDVIANGKNNRDYITRLIQEDLARGKTPESLVDYLKTVNEQDLRYMW